ncbi:MAG: AMP-binding protein, partial [Arenicellales bacterium]
LPDQRAEVIHQPIAAWAKHSPDACAISSTGLRPLTYEGLNTQLDRICQLLQGFGLGTSDTVAVVLPNGPEAAVVTLAVASMARCAPLNPGFRARELTAYFDDLNVKALIVESDNNHLAHDIARDRGICVIKLIDKSDQTAGVFNLTCEAFDNNSNKLSHPDPPSTDDIALLLHTSGTTSRPKIVPLTHRNLCTSASNIGHALQLTPEDCCLNVMPLFHIHGLVGTLLSSLHAGANIICCPDFVAPRVLDWLGDFPVTWYSAVPTMHQTILERVRKQPEKLSSISLRFIRSASASLPGSVLKELEQTFSAPVIEAYGMTEAAHQIATNPLPPGERKPGSVGLGADSSVSIIGANNHNLHAMERGEVMIRGDNVTSGYLDNEEANHNALFEGWLKTGDEGYLDKDGYLFLTGRLKEMINRGGEKIAPREIDEVLLEHPAVFQAVAFSMPDDYVGEEVAAVVVTDPNVSVTAEALQEYVGERLADYKVPRRIVFTDEIPVGATGKLQRIGLAELLGLTGEAENSSTSTAESSGEALTEQVIQDIWSEVLAIDDVNVDENFFVLGGDSILATMAMTRINKAFDVDLNIAVFFNTPTIRKLAHYIEERGPAVQQNQIKEVSREGLPDEELDSATLTGHVLVAKSLKRLGITHIYGLTGTPINETLAECAHAGIRVIAVHNQSAGAQMAAAQNYTAGKLIAATIMTPGPGMANATMGALVAKDNGWPLLLIGGGRRQNQRNSGVFQDLDSISIFKSITKMSALVESIQRVPEYFQRALTVAMNGKPGPVYLDVPEDVLFGEVEASHVSHT